MNEAESRVKELEKRLQDTAAQLDRMAESMEANASWESAGHLRGRVRSNLRSIARGITRDISS